MEVRFHIDRREFRMFSRYFGRRSLLFWIAVMTPLLAIMIVASASFLGNVPLLWMLMQVFINEGILVGLIVLMAWSIFILVALPEVKASKWSPHNEMITKISPIGVQTERLIHEQHGERKESSSFGWHEIKKAIEYRGFLILLRPVSMISFAEIIPKRAFDSLESYGVFKDRVEKWLAASKTSA